MLAIECERVIERLLAASRALAAEHEAKLAALNWEQS